MQKIIFKNYPDTSTPINATNLNTIQDNIENALFSGNYNDLTNKPTIPTIENSLDSGSTTNGASVHAVAQINTYSETEIKIGTWINNKPIYRKVIDCGGLPNATSKNVAHGISNLDTVTLLRGVAYNSTAGTRLPIPYSDTGNASWSVQMFCNQTQIVLIAGDNKSAYQQSYVIIEYTKTTD